MAATELTPMLTVRNAAAAVDFYCRVLDAEELSRLQAPTGQLVIEVSVQGNRFFVVDENPSAENLSPKALGGTTVRLNLIVDDPDALADRMVNSGGRLIFPVADQPYGLRQGRVADPEGHHWLLGRPLSGT
jgi:PhnB protein